MTTTTLIVGAVSAHGSELASWVPLRLFLGAFVAIVVALLVTNRNVPVLQRIPVGLERVTGQPGWAMATVGTALFGLLVAGQGFYADVAWHVALGRDKALFTAPHTSIFIGLQLIFAASAGAVLFATATRVPTRWRIGALRVPYSSVPLFALGAAAVTGFPLDEVWHQAFGIDVTMWSPTHMLMILGASFTGLAAWLVLAEAGVPPRSGAWGRGLHIACAVLVLQGLSAPLGEFAYGVPQFQQLFHPVLLCVAAAFALVATRLVIGRWSAVAVAVISLLLRAFGTSDGPVHTRQVGTFLVSAVVVEVLALLSAADRRPLRFALLSAAGVGTLGLAGEWVWNQGAYQPWHASLLPSALVLGLLGAFGAAIAAVPFAAAVTGSSWSAGAPVRRGLLVGALVAVVAVVVLPLPRHVGSVDAAIRLSPASTPGRANVEVTLTPADAAAHARWFQASSWQGGGLVVRDMVKVGPGRYRSEGSIPVSKGWKSLVRLHRGDQLMTLPIYLPADPEIHAAEITAIDRTGPLQAETRYLLRETHGGASWLKVLVYSLLVLASGAWVVAFSLAVARLQPVAVADLDLRTSDAVSAAPTSPPEPTAASVTRGDVASIKGPPIT